VGLTKRHSFCEKLFGEVSRKLTDLSIEDNHVPWVNHTPVVLLSLSRGDQKKQTPDSLPLMKG